MRLCVNRTRRGIDHGLCGLLVDGLFAADRDGFLVGDLPGPLDPDGGGHLTMLAAPELRDLIAEPGVEFPGARQNGRAGVAQAMVART